MKLGRAHVDPWPAGSSGRRARTSRVARVGHGEARKQRSAWGRSPGEAVPHRGEEEGEDPEGAGREAPASSKERLRVEGKSRACWPCGLTACLPLTGLIG
ncbi:hypothetical protein NDU88_003577 [Pleurodeles waltl]|uniref:Uncharacterized protein n=1 Tax=Pleurodeles waltl TaxID=8319 RepID=A0AAV7T5V7_PLEWA|nr:hypothetical protein NDU88_003577 [Pleurodeles waltl]